MKKITLIGGDNRLKILKENLKEKGYFVDTIGLYDNDNGDISTSNFIILPVPTTKDGINVYTPLTNKLIPLESISNAVIDTQLILCCNFCFENKKCVDYGALDSYALLNSVPTAEGAIKIAIENTPFTLWKSNVLVVGYGKVGKILADRLKSLGCDVTVSARKPADQALIEALGFKYIDTRSLNLKPLCYDIIFNTVDVNVINNDSLKILKTKLLVDLSTFGGFSLETANKYGIKAIKAPGLPSLTAPQTAAEILTQTVTHIIDSYN